MPAHVASIQQFSPRIFRVNTRLKVVILAAGRPRGSRGSSFLLSPKGKPKTPGSSAPRAKDDEPPISGVRPGIFAPILRHCERPETPVARFQRAIPRRGGAPFGIFAPILRHTQRKTVRNFRAYLARKYARASGPV